MNRRSKNADLLDQRELRVVTSCPLALSVSLIERSRHDVLRAQSRPVIGFLAEFTRIPKKMPRPKTSCVFFLARIATEVWPDQASHGTKRASSADIDLSLGSIFGASCDNVLIAIPEKIPWCEGPHVSQSW